MWCFSVCELKPPDKTFCSMESMIQIIVQIYVLSKRNFSQINNKFIFKPHTNPEMLYPGQLSNLGSSQHC